jgi:hypothetical protein
MRPRIGRKVSDRLLEIFTAAAVFMEIPARPYSEDGGEQPPDSTSISTAGAVDTDEHSSEEIGTLQAKVDWMFEGV